MQGPIHSINKVPINRFPMKNTGYVVENFDLQNRPTFKHVLRDLPGIFSVGQRTPYFKLEGVFIRSLKQVK